MMEMSVGIGRRDQYLFVSFLERRAAVVRAGFPMKCLQASGWLTMPASPPFPYKWRSGVRVPEELGPGRSYGFDRVLPLGIMWRGFLVNAMCCTALLGLTQITLGGAIRLVRRRVREKRNLCLQCGYQLIGISGSVCPECGTSNVSKP
jgi:hypothetical protein